MARKYIEYAWMKKLTEREIKTPQDKQALQIGANILFSSKKEPMTEINKHGADFAMAFLVGSIQVQIGLDKKLPNKPEMDRLITEFSKNRNLPKELMDEIMSFLWMYSYI